MRLVDSVLPPYSYVPGLFPHPESHPDGHRFEVAAVETAVDPNQWQDCRTYLHGCDLFNHGYYWEAHECWETLWHSAGRRGLQADFLKALIKLAAALVKAREGRAKGVARHAERAKTLLLMTADRVASRTYMGLFLPQLIEDVGAIVQSPNQYVDVRPDPVVRIAPFELMPGKEPEGRSGA
jgi:predicted metal-dependent hydrolase